MRLIPVKYHNKCYPDSVIPLLDEIAGNLDSKPILTNHPYSLHTEYSYMKRHLNSDLLTDLDELKSANKAGIPQLWKNTQWSEQYATFIERIIGNSIAPEVIEIHPPFKDYCEDIECFWERYMVFFNRISQKYPNTKIIIENRCGTMYTGSTFLFSTCDEMLKLCEFISMGHSELGVIIDYPQLFSAEKIKMDNVKIDKILKFNESLKSYVSVIDSIHLWGKRKSKNSNRWSPHSGDLNTFFSGNQENKSIFLNSLKNTYNDKKERYFVPEVNTTEDDLKSIVNDLLNSGISFVQERFSDYLIAINWDNKRPEFILGSKIQQDTKEISAIGSFFITVGDKKYCVGNKDIISHKYIGCPYGQELYEKTLKCTKCDNTDILKYCVRCTGDQCFTNNADILTRCNNEHFIYLAFFPDDVVKVGIAHSRRKYARLLEQGAMYSYIIASCKSGKKARQIESDIKKLGVKDKVTSAFKIKNVKYFDINQADQMIVQAYNLITNKVNSIHSEGVQLFLPPEKYVQTDTLSILSEIYDKTPRQLTIWDFIEPNTVSANSIEILDDINKFNGEIIAFVGSISILKKDSQYYLYDFKQLYGREILIKRIS